LGTGEIALLSSICDHTPCTRITNGAIAGSQQGKTDRSARRVAVGNHTSGNSLLIALNIDRATLSVGSESATVTQYHGVCNRTRRASTLASSNIPVPRGTSPLTCPLRPPSNTILGLPLCRLNPKRAGASVVASPNTNPRMWWKSWRALD